MSKQASPPSAARSVAGADGRTIAYGVPAGSLGASGWAGALMGNLAVLASLTDGQQSSAKFDALMQQVTGIDWHDIDIAIPAFLTIAFMPFGYSITVGIGVGFITYVVMRVATGKAKRVHILMWITAVLFVIYFLLGPIQSVLAS